MMIELASAGQLRASFLRWALVTVPGIVLLGFLGSVVSGSGVGNPWFDSLVKPSLYPPPQVFGIVWSVLYVMLGVAFALVLSARGAWWRGRAAIAFLVQLALNLAWSPVFFGLHDIRAAMIVIVVLDALVLVTVVLFWRVRRVAGLLLLPYLAWIGFATLLNWEFLQANPGGGSERATGAVQRYEL